MAAQKPLVFAMLWSSYSRPTDVGNSGVEPAMAWVMDHMGDSDFNDPFQPAGAGIALPGLLHWSGEAVHTVHTRHSLRCTHSSLHGTRYTVHGTRYTVHGTRYTHMKPNSI